MTEDLKKEYSSKSEQTTRVKIHKKQAKTTVGITLNPSLLTEARKHRLNISRITEQALRVFNRKSARNLRAKSFLRPVLTHYYETEIT
jgi:post-segregation antitoxin (ccd killing protein)